ncbi:jerky protein homolog-like [Bactrocera tryoni]|uniref:jerky protein homolog-like n=1 Tax=Bactrocera tryoni TaxID=59916 RepID=UPI001A969C81|nr:jerky protein homolog-like [Bactrocera tryoni]
MPTKQRKSLQIRLNLHQKAEILRKLDEVIHGNRLALDYNVSKAAISKIKKKRHEILEAVANTHEVATKKTLHKSEYPVLEARLYKWFLSQRQRNCAMSGPILKARAELEIAKLHTGKQFHACDGWLANFKKRFGIRHLKICVEILSSDKSGVTPFIHNFRAKMNEEIPLLTLIRSNSSHDDTLREVQSLLSKVGGVDVSSEDIENWNDDQNTEDDEDFEVSDNEDEEPVVEEDMQQQKVSFSEAVECIGTLIKWYENNNDANQISHLINMRTRIVRSYYTKEKKQTSLDRFFKPALTN